MKGFPRLYAIVDRAALEACSCQPASSAGTSRGMGVRAFAMELREAGVRLVQYRDKVGAPQEILRAAAEIAELFEGTDAMLILNDRADLAVLAGWDGVHVGQGDLGVEAARRVLGAEGPMTPLMRDEAAHEWGTRRVSGENGGGLEQNAPHPAAIRPHRGWGTRIPPTLATMSHPNEQARRESQLPSRRWGTRRGMGAGRVVGVSTHTEEQVRAVEPTSQNRDMGHPDLWLDMGPDYAAVGPVFATGSKADAEPVVGLEGVRRARALTTKPLVAIGGITLENAWSVVEAGADAVAVIGGLFVEGRRVRDVARDFLRILG